MILSFSKVVKDLLASLPQNDGIGKYVVISLSSLQARIVMMNKIPNSTNMIF